MSHDQYTKSQAARHWLGLGFDLLPIQSNTKFVLKGFGVHQRRIRDEDQINQYWHNDNLNIAVVSCDDHFILDFDKFDLYVQWAKSVNECFSLSYTEHTPRGAHVFMAGDVVPGLKLIEGVEVKRVGLVSPSVVAGIPYTQGLGGIYRGNVDDAFSSLSVPGSCSAYVLRLEAQLQRGKQARDWEKLKCGDDLIATIKAQVKIVDVFMKYSSTCDSLDGSARWLSARCPFHKNGKESRSSFWIDTQRGTFGCHTCKVTGDVINLFSLFTGKPVPQAIRVLKDKLVLVGHQ